MVRCKSVYLFKSVGATTLSGLGAHLAELVDALVLGAN